MYGVFKKTMAITFAMSILTMSGVSDLLAQQYDQWDPLGCPSNANLWPEVKVYRTPHFPSEGINSFLAAGETWNTADARIRLRMLGEKGTQFGGSAYNGDDINHVDYQYNPQRDRPGFEETRFGGSGGYIIESD